MDAAGSSISVNVRVRPFTVKESSQIAPQQEERLFLGDGALASNPTTTMTAAQRGIRKVIQVLDERVLVFDPADTNPMVKFQKSLLPGKKVKDMRYAFDHIFDENASQREVYAHTCRPLLDGLFDGYNATCFAYGATGCGKTHTISGTREDPGIISQTFEDLFQRIKAIEQDKTVELSVTYLEIYNETIRDLLIPPGTSKALNLREDANKQISVPGLSTHCPQSVEEVIELILQGNANRTISPTEANAVSSRSHAVLQVNVAQKARTANIQEDHTMATLSIIDLAGSERASVTKNRGERLLEGANINRSLLALGNCINALCDPHRRNHVPYRDSKLTRLLKFSLGGNCRTVMVVCVSPSSAHYDETHNTLKYGNRAKNIKTKVTRNIVSVDRHVGQYVKIIYDLRQEVEELKKRLSERSEGDEGKVEKELRLQNLKHEEGYQQLKAAYETDSRAAKELRAAQVTELRQVSSQMAYLRAWLAAFAQVSAQEDYREASASLSSVADENSHKLRELQAKHDHLQHLLGSCPAIGAIDTVVATLQRNHATGNVGSHGQSASSGTRLLCRALELEADRLKNKIVNDHYESEMCARRSCDLELERHTREILVAAIQATVVLDTDGGTTEEEVAHFDALYGATFESGVAALQSLPFDASTHEIPHPSPVKPLAHLMSRIAVASPARSSPRRVKASTHRPSTVFPKRRVSVGTGTTATKKSVRWGIDTIDDVPIPTTDDSITASPPRTRLTSAAAPPSRKRVQPTTNSTPNSPPAQYKRSRVAVGAVSPDTSASGGGGGLAGRPLKDLPLRRPSSSGAVAVDGSLVRSNSSFMRDTAASRGGLSALALANIASVDHSPYDVKRSTHGKENGGGLERPRSRGGEDGVRASSLGGGLGAAVRQSLGGGAHTRSASTSGVVTTAPPPPPQPTAVGRTSSVWR
ncbi:tubulin-dependent ATPase kip3 [Savitreella phatthalungensis]